MAPVCKTLAVLQLPALMSSAVMVKDHAGVVPLHKFLHHGENYFHDALHAVVNNYTCVVSCARACDCQMHTETAAA